MRQQTAHHWTTNWSGSVYDQKPDTNQVLPQFHSLSAPELAKALRSEVKKIKHPKKPYVVLWYEGERIRAFPPRRELIDKDMIIYHLFCFFAFQYVPWPETIDIITGEGDVCEY